MVQIHSPRPKHRDDCASLAGLRDIQLGRRGGPRSEAGVEHRQHEQGRDRGGDDPADDDGGEGALHLRTDAGVQRHRYEPERRDEPRHQYGTDPGLGGLTNRGVEISSLPQQPLHLGDQHHVAEHRDARERDEAHAGRDRKGHCPEPERRDAADRSKRHAGEDAKRVRHPAIGDVEQRQDEQERDGHDNEQARPRPFDVLELPPEPGVVPRRKLDLLQRRPQLGDEGADVSVSYVHLHADPPPRPLAADGRRPVDDVDLRQRAERQSSAGRRRDEDLADALRRLPRRLIETQH